MKWIAHMHYTYLSYKGMIEVQPPKGGYAIATVAIICIVICSCTGHKTAAKPQTASPAFAMAAQAAPVQSQTLAQPPVEGSLWREDGELTNIFANIKARRIGDLVTIKIVESSSATNQASTKTGRKTTLTAGLENFFNIEKEYPSDQPFFNPFAGVKGSYQGDFDGSGTTKRSGALTAYMTARIVNILPDGNLVIQGNREVRVNNESQIITLTGLVRPRDISADNVVQSTYIADARINYSGSGVINDRQKPGWLTRILDYIWPF